MSTDTHAPAAAPAAPRKSRKGLIVILTLLIVVLAGAGGGAYWFLSGGAQAEAAEAEPEAPAPTGIVPLDPFVVNLADPGASRFLRVTLGLVVADEAIAKELEEDHVTEMRIRSAVIELLSQKQAGELVTPEGKAELKKSLAHAAQGALAAGASEDEEHHVEVADVLFGEFIVQY